MAHGNANMRNEVRQTVRKANEVASRGVPAFEQVEPTCQFILDECDVTYLSNRLNAHEISRVRKLGRQAARAGIPSCDSDGVFVSPYTNAQYDVYLSDCHVNERNFLARQVVTQFGRQEGGITSSHDAREADAHTSVNASGTPAEARARARAAARDRAATGEAMRNREELALMCEAAGRANLEILSHAFDRAKSISLELANAYIAGAVEADAKMKVLARWLPLPWVRARASRSRIDSAGASQAHVEWPDYVPRQVMMVTEAS